MDKDDVVRDKNGRIEYLCDGEIHVIDKTFTADDIMEIKSIYQSLGKELPYEEEQKMWNAIEK